MTDTSSKLAVSCIQFHLNRLRLNKRTDIDTKTLIHLIYECKMQFYSKVIEENEIFKYIDWESYNKLPLPYFNG